MSFDETALLHDRNCFSRETLTARLERLRFNNLARMELFLWDLEIFLQIQTILKDKIVLKGGAAAQFYLPVEYQRTSVDIDMICTADQEAVEKALASIEGRFKGTNDLFMARLHKPKNPKATLPMMTCYMDVLRSAQKGSCSEEGSQASRKSRSSFTSRMTRPRFSESPPLTSSPWIRNKPTSSCP